MVRKRLSLGIPVRSLRYGLACGAGLVPVAIAQVLLRSASLAFGMTVLFFGLSSYLAIARIELGEDGVNIRRQGFLSTRETISYEEIAGVRVVSDMPTDSIHLDLRDGRLIVLGPYDALLMILCGKSLGGIAQAIRDRLA